ncbi:MAG: hypothetical protein ACFLMY_05020 [Candidatus Brachytrichaceae bacterium NZ_4S206]|jgi:hypothetical protein
MANSNPNPIQPRPTQGNPTTPLLYCRTRADQQAYRLERAEQALIAAALDAVHARLAVGSHADAGDFAALQAAMRDASAALERMTYFALDYERLVNQEGSDEQQP